jgi:RNA polymerase sigma factor (sigma-70 family)
MQRFPAIDCQSTAIQPMIDQLKLVKDSLKGKRDAQRQLYELFAAEMLAVCYRYTKSTADAEDVLQDGFVKVFTHLHQFKADGEIGAWIRRIMVNTAINYLKKNSRYQSELAFSEIPMHPVHFDNPEIHLQAKELADLIRQLPPGFQTILNLHAVEGFTHVEIGQILGINEGTSRSQYSRARALLISWIKKNDIDSKIESYARQ